MYISPGTVNNFNHAPQTSPFYNTLQPPSSTPSSSSNKGNSGWYVAAATFGGILLSGTRAAPFVFGILSLATLYQLNELLVQRKTLTT